MSEPELIDLRPYHCKRLIAENQRLFTSGGLGDQRFYSKSIDLVKTVFNEDTFIPYRLVTCEGMAGPVHQNGVYAITRRLKTFWYGNKEKDANIAENIQKELTEEILTNIENNCGWEGTVEQVIDLMSTQVIHAEWILGTKQALKPFRGKFELDFIEYDWPTILIGNKEGYGFYPYIAFTITPIDNHNMFGILFRYGRQLFSSRCFAKIV